MEYELLEAARECLVPQDALSRMLGADKALLLAYYRTHSKIEWVRDRLARK